MFLFLLYCYSQGYSTSNETEMRSDVARSVAKWAVMLDLKAIPQLLWANIVSRVHLSVACCIWADHTSCTATLTPCEMCLTSSFKHTHVALIRATTYTDGFSHSDVVDDQTRNTHKNQTPVFLYLLFTVFHTVQSTLWLLLTVCLSPSRAAELLGCHDFYTW